MIGIASDSIIAKGRHDFIHWTPPSEENKVFVKELQRKGTDIKIVTDQIFNAGAKTFRSIIAKAKNKGKIESGILAKIFVDKSIR